MSLRTWVLAAAAAGAVAALVSRSQQRGAPHLLRETDLSLGEPKALMPPFLGPALQEHLAEFGRYPPITGIPALRQSIAAWLGRRYPALDGVVDPEQHVLPLNGSREGLFSAIFPALARKPSVARFGSAS